MLINTNEENRTDIIHEVPCPTGRPSGAWNSRMHRAANANGRRPSGHTLISTSSFGQFACEGILFSSNATPPPFSSTPYFVLNHDWVLLTYSTLSLVLLEQLASWNRILQRSATHYSSCLRMSCVMAAAAFPAVIPFIYENV